MVLVETKVATKTKVITHTKIAVAVMLLGLSSLAASAAAGTNGRVQAISKARLPDLQIHRVIFNPHERLVLDEHEDGTTSYLEVPNTKDRLSIFYRNTGETEVLAPFTIRLTLSPVPYVFGDVEHMIKPEQMTSTSLALEPQALPPEDLGVYDVLVEKTETDLVHAKFVNTYSLEKEDEGRIELLLPRYYRQMLNGGLLSIHVEIDPDNIIEERFETNNEFIKLISYADVEEKQDTACSAFTKEDGTNEIFEGCNEHGYFYACVDRYTEEFIACGEFEFECNEHPGDIQACQTQEIPEDRPLFQTVSLQSLNETFTVDYSKSRQNYVEGTVFERKPIPLGTPLKLTMTVDNVSEKTEYGYYIADEEVELTEAGLRPIVKKIRWDETPSFTMMTRKKTFAVHVFTRNNDKKGALLETVGYDMDDITTFIITLP